MTIEQQDTKSYKVVYGGSSFTLHDVSPDTTDQEILNFIAESYHSYELRGGTIERQTVNGEEVLYPKPAASKNG